MDEKLLQYLDKYIENREQQLNERIAVLRSSLASTSIEIFLASLD